MLPPVAPEPLGRPREEELGGNPLDLEIHPDEFDASPPAKRAGQLSRDRQRELLELEFSAREFEREAAESRPPAQKKRSSQPAQVVDHDLPSVEFAPIGTSELSPSDAPAAAKSDYDKPPSTAAHEYNLDDHGYDAAPDPTLQGEPLPDLLRRSSTPDESTASVMSSLPASGAHPVDTHAPVSRLGAEVEEALDEAEFFASQGQFDEALEIVQEAILIAPNSKELKARLADYEARAEARAAEQQAAKERAVDTSDDDSFDIAEQLAHELAETEEAGPDEMIDVESVFAQFKKGVAEQIAPDDSETHFDLGIAYKEMGLVDDAINEFEVAVKGKKRACTALNMIAMCHLERGKPELALTYFQRALDSEGRGPAEELALNYEIGSVYEQMGQLDRALTAYEAVAARDRAYRGISGKLELLKKRGVKARLAK